MLLKLSCWFLKNSTYPILITSVVFFILFNVLVFPYFMSNYGLINQPILDLMFGFTPEQAYNILGGYGDKGREGIMLINSIVDFLYPLVFGTLLINSISLGMIKNITFPPKWVLLNLLPLIAVLSDYAENVGILNITRSFPERQDAFAWLASIAGMIKWTFVFFSIVTLLILVLVNAKRKYFKG